jgi:uncharacterized membrane protein YuzA (DUF378 family)
MFQVITWFLVVIGGLQFALSGIGINLMDSVFGGSHQALMGVAIGMSVLYHAVPALKSHLAKL